MVTSRVTTVSSRFGGGGGFGQVAACAIWVSASSRMRSASVRASWAASSAWARSSMACTVILDEAANVCRIDALPDLCSFFGAQGISVTTSCSPTNKEPGHVAGTALSAGDGLVGTRRTFRRNSSNLTLRSCRNEPCIGFYLA